MITPRVTPPDVDLFDMDEYDHARNRAYCEELAAQMLAAELDPKNFFRQKGKRDYSLGHATSSSASFPRVQRGGPRALR